MSARVQLATLAAVLIAGLASLDDAAGAKLDCLTATSESNPATALATPVPKGLVAELAVLRRAQQPSDVLPALSVITLPLSIDLGGYYPAATRRLGRTVYLLVGQPQPLIIPPAGCLARHLRTHRQQLVRRARERAEQPLYCLSTRTEATCQLASNLAIEGDLVDQELRADLARELVPDGVASVTLTYRSGQSQTVRVANNLFQFNGPIGPRHEVLKSEQTINTLTDKLAAGHRLSKPERAALKHADRRLAAGQRHLAPATVVWRSATGTTLRTVHPPISTGNEQSIAGTGTLEEVTGDF